MIIKTKRSIQCVWDGTLAGIMLTNDAATAGKSDQTTTKVIAAHGWLDNLNSMLPVAEKLVNRHPNYEIYLYDRAGHGFSSHIPKGFDYSQAHNIMELRVVIQTLGWDKEKILIVGHSSGGVLGILYAASYPENVLCIVAIDSLPRPLTPADNFFNVHRSHIDAFLEFYNTPSKSFGGDLTIEKVIDLTISSRPGIHPQAAKLLAERLVRPDEENELYFTRDLSLMLEPLVPLTDEIVRSVISAVKAFVLFIGTVNPEWPRDPRSIDLFKEHNPNFEMTLYDKPHHFHMTDVDLIVDRIDEYFNKYLPKNFL